VSQQPSTLSASGWTLAVEPMATDPATFGAFFRAEVTRWTEVARRAGITAQ